MKTYEKTRGTCSRCQMDNRNVTILTGSEYVCDDCLSYFYTRCRECGKYWDDSYMEFSSSPQGKLICESCASIYRFLEDDFLL